MFILVLCKINTDTRLTQSIPIDNMILGLFNLPIVFYIYSLCVSEFRFEMTYIPKHLSKMETVEKAYCTDLDQ